MKLITFFLLCLFIPSTLAALSLSLSLGKRTPPPAPFPFTPRNLLNTARKTRLYSFDPNAVESAVKLVHQLKTRCAPNLCFALDGSGSIGFDNFELQKEFVLLITAIVGAEQDSTFSATQYGGLNIPISTPDDAEDFIVKLEASQYQSVPLTFLNAGLLYCTTVLKRFQGAPAKLIVLGDGGATFGREFGFLSGRKIAENFRNRHPGNGVCAVTVGYEGKPQLFVDIAGGTENVVGVDGWPKILNALRSLVRAICDRPPEF